jgi:hypothetical protein
MIGHWKKLSVAATINSAKVQSASGLRQFVPLTCLALGTFATANTNCGVRMNLSKDGLRRKLRGAFRCYKHDHLQKGQKRSTCSKLLQETRHIFRHGLDRTVGGAE